MDPSVQGSPYESMDSLLNSLNSFAGDGSDTAKEMVRAEEGQQFYLADGTQLFSLQDLRQALVSMTKEQYAFHADETKNDFAMWVKTVLKDPACARDLQKCRTPLSAKRVVIKHLNEFYS